MIESALLEHLKKQERHLGRYLARYYGQMAIFNQEAPNDQDKGWDVEDDYEADYFDDYEDELIERKSQYGRIVFAMDMNDDPERKISGTLAVDVYCEKNVQEPEELEPIVRTLIDGYFFSTKEITIAAQWSASNYFTEPTEKVVGVTLTFDLLAFPTQITINPDPIELFNSWTKNELQDILKVSSIRVIGYDALESAWKPTNENPAIYWRQENLGPCGWIPDTYNCSWLTAVIRGHIMAADKNQSMIIARHIQHLLTMKRRLIFEDMAPLMVDRNIRVSFSSDPLRVGQITIDATFGLLRIPMEGTKIVNTSITERRSGDD